MEMEREWKTMKGKPRSGNSGALGWVACAVITGTLGASCLLMPSTPPVSAEQGLPPGSSVKAAIAAALAEPGVAYVDGAAIDSGALAAVYEEREYAPFWLGDSGEVSQRARSVIDVLASAASEGLDPRRYDIEEIRRRVDARDQEERVCVELLLSSATLAYIEHQVRGLRPPAPGDPEASVDRPGVDAAELLRELADAPDSADRLRSLGPPVAEYRRLRDALARYREIERAHGWPVIPAAETLRVGASGPVVLTLRRRLESSGDLPAGAPKSSKYDRTLANAVRVFQERHGLVSDGSVGTATREALNVPVSRRIEQIIVNMERWRWIGRELGDRYVKVNIPGFTLELVEDGLPVRSMPVVVGRKSWQTPTFSSEIRALVFNPSWFVPPRIARDEILPKARADAEYLTREDIVVRRISVPVEAGAGEPGGGDRPPVAREILRLRRLPGPKNPLGRVKFSIPNVFGVYLHDTPARRDFARPVRALSHGCVRLEDALGLADALMRDVGDWTPERRDQILSAWSTRTIALPRPIPVHLLYETAWADPSGTVHFRSDIYGRDDVLAKRMAEPPRARPDLMVRPRPDDATPSHPQRRTSARTSEGATL